ncbi:MAG: MarC family protein [Chitinophagaceae bacterium]
MLSHLHTFIHMLSIGFIALFPVVNPIGSAFIITPYFNGLTRNEQKIAVKKITVYAFFICLVSLFAGRWILEFFGISVPVIQLAGGMVICKFGWQYLFADRKEVKKPDEDPGKNLVSDGYRNLEGKLFYPITFPVTTGAGTIAVLFTLSAHSENANVTTYLVNTAAILLSIIIICLLIYIFYMKTERIINLLGSNGETIVTRLTAFLIFCVGLQIAVTGIRNLVKG